MNRDELRAKLQTIVIVIMENRSFDHVLGHLRDPAQENRADVEGIDVLANPRYINPSLDGVGIGPFWMADAPFPSDMPHGKGDVQTQLAASQVAGTHLMYTSPSPRDRQKSRMPSS